LKNIWTPPPPPPPKQTKKKQKKIKKIYIYTNFLVGGGGAHILQNTRKNNFDVISAISATTVLYKNKLTQCRELENVYTQTWHTVIPFQYTSFTRGWGELTVQYICDWPTL
jgi:hypothetical protein